MLIDYHLGATSIVVRVKLRNSSVSTGAGLTGLTSASSGLIIAAIADNEAATTAYTVAGSLIDTIATLGTYAAPTATHCRFKEVDATNHKGLYEIQLENSRYAVSSAKSLTISLSGATNLAECDVCIPLRTVNPYDANFGLTGLTGLTAPTAGALPTIGSGTGQINPSGGKVPATLASTDVTGNVPADLQTIKTQTVTCAAGVTINPFVGTATAALVVNGSGFVTLADGSFTAAKVAAAAITSSAFGTDAISASAFAQAAADKAWSSAARTLTAFGFTVSADIQTIKTQAVTCSAGVTVGPFVGTTNLITTDSSGRVKVQVGTAAGQIDTVSGAVKVTPGTAADLGTNNYLGRLLWLLMPNDGSSDTGTLPDQTGMTTSQIKLASTSNTTNVRPGYVFTPTSGLQTKGRHITSFDTTTKIVTLNNAWVTNPATGDTYRIDPPPKANVGGYGLLQSPDYSILTTPGQTIATDASHNVTVDSTALLAAIWPDGTPTVNGDGSMHADVVSINEVAVTFETIPTAAQNAAAVWDLTTSGHTTSGTFGAAMGAAGAAGDPLATDVATGYTGTQAGAILKALDLNNALTWRDQTSNATPNGHDARFAAWFGIFGAVGDPNPDGTIPALAPDDSVIFTYDEAPGVMVAPDGLDLVIVEPTAGINLRQAMQGLLADSAGTLAGAGTGTIVINGANTAVPRIIATTDSLGNRLQVSFLFDV